MPTAKIVLCISQQACLLSHWSGAVLQYFETYAHGEKALATMRQYLLQHQTAPIYLMVDTVAEDYQFTVLPHAIGRARQEMLRRKLSQFGHDYLYKTATFLYRQQTTRKEDCYVLFALTNIRVCQPYLAMLKAETLLLAGIYALPMVSQIIVQRQQPKIPCLLLCEYLSSGFRQTFISHSGVRFSRLSAMVDQQSAQSKALCMTEIEKMRAYLLSQRMLAEDVELPILISSTDGVDAQMIAQLNQQARFTAQALPETAVSGLGADALKQQPELRHMQTLALGYLPENLALASDVEHYRIHQLAQRFYVASIVVMLFGLCVMAYLLFQGYQKQAQLPMLGAQTAQILDQHAKIQQPTSPVPAADLETVVQIAKAVNQASPLRLMDVVSEALETVPDVSLTRLRWVQTDQQTVQDAESDIPMKVWPVRWDANKRMLPLQQLGFLQATINTAVRERDVPMIIEQFVSALRAKQQIKSVKRMPLSNDTQQTAHLVGSTADEVLPQSWHPAFQLRIVMQVERLHD